MTKKVMHVINGNRAEREERWKELHALWNGKKKEWFEDRIKFDAYSMKFQRSKAKWEKDPKSCKPSYSKADVKKLEKDLKEWEMEIKKREMVDDEMERRFGVNKNLSGEQLSRKPKLRLIHGGCKCN